ncbi:MAG: glycosyltransferase family 39 protein [Candidatus Omnitrophica bacterium]|nr:glycosyltransferase family 39 protein [Candidatus Omnitrophota bacterium]
MELIGLCSAIAAVLFIGFNILCLIMGRFDGLGITETVFISYGIGIGFISLEMLLFYIAGWKFSIPALLLPWTAVVAAGLVIARKPLRSYWLTKQSQKIDCFGLRPRNDVIAISFLSVFLKFGIALEVAYAFFRALIRPIEAYDAVAIYAIKSKIFFLAKAIPETYFPSLVHGFPHPDYPLNIPLAETFIYMAMGSMNDQLVKIIFPLFFVGILVALYFAIRRFASRAYALLFTFIIATIPQFNAYATNAYQELPLAFYCFTGSVFLFRWLERRDDFRYLALSAVMAALSAWTKNEGAMYCVINASIVLWASLTARVRKGGSNKPVYAAALYAFIIVLIILPWAFIKRKYGIINDEINLANLNPLYMVRQLHKLGPILYELQKQLFGPKKWLILWPAVIAVAALKYKELFKGVTGYITASLVLAFCGYIVFYMISYVDVVFFASKTWSRFLLHLLPLTILWLACLLKEDIKL